MIQFIVAIVFLVLLTFIDMKTFDKKGKGIPAFITTLFLAVMFIFSGIDGLITGIFGFILGMLLVDLDLFQGVADWKVFVACSMTLPTISYVALFGIFTSVVAVAYQYIAKKGKHKQIPFIPAMLISYLWTISGLVFL